MAETYSRDGSALVIRFNSETIRIEAWGPDALRVRARPGGDVVAPHVSALLDPVPTSPEIEIDGRHARITNGRIRAEVRLARRLGADVNTEPEITFRRADTGQELLAETRSLNRVLLIDGSAL